MSQTIGSAKIVFTAENQTQRVFQEINDSLHHLQRLSSGTSQLAPAFAGPSPIEQATALQNAKALFKSTVDQQEVNARKAREASQQRLEEIGQVRVLSKLYEKMREDAFKPKKGIEYPLIDMAAERRLRIEQTRTTRIAAEKKEQDKLLKESAAKQVEQAKLEKQIAAKLHVEKLAAEAQYLKTKQQLNKQYEADFNARMKQLTQTAANLPRIDPLIDTATDFFVKSQAKQLKVIHDAQNQRMQELKRSRDILIAQSADFNREMRATTLQAGRKTNIDYGLTDMVAARNASIQANRLRIAEEQRADEAERKRQERETRKQEDKEKRLAAQHARQLQREQQLASVAANRSVTGGLAMPISLATAHHILSIGSELEALKMSFFAFTGSVSVAAVELDQLHAKADKYSLSFIGLAKGFKQFAASAYAAGVSTKDTKMIFDAFTRTGAALRQSTEQTELTFRALSQMVSKGTITAEEWKLQLGEQLPGAMGILSRALGVTTAEVVKMMSEGLIPAVPALKLVSFELDRTFQILEGEKNLTTAINKAKNAWHELIGKFAENQGIISAIDSLGDLIKTLEHLYTAASRPLSFFSQKIGVTTSHGEEVTRSSLLFPGALMFRELGFPALASWVNQKLKADTLRAKIEEIQSGEGRQITHAISGVTNKQAIETITQATREVTKLSIAMLELQNNSKMPVDQQRRQLSALEEEIAKKQKIVAETRSTFLPKHEIERRHKEALQLTNLQASLAKALEFQDRESKDPWRKFRVDQHDIVVKWQDALTAVRAVVGDPNATARAREEAIRNAERINAVYETSIVSAAENRDKAIKTKADEEERKRQAALNKQLAAEKKKNDALLKEQEAFGQDSIYLHDKFQQYQEQQFRVQEDFEQSAESKKWAQKLTQLNKYFDDEDRAIQKHFAERTNKERNLKVREALPFQEQTLRQKLAETREIVTTYEREKFEEEDAKRLEAAKLNLEQKYDEARARIDEASHERSEQREQDHLLRKLRRQFVTEKKEYESARKHLTEVNQVELDKQWHAYEALQINFQNAELEGLKNRQDSLRAWSLNTKTNIEMVRDAVVQTFKSMTDAIKQFVMTGEIDMKNFARSIAANFLAMKIQAALFQPLGLWASGQINGLFAPGTGTATPVGTHGLGTGAPNLSLQVTPRALGGPVRRGMPYLVGEAGKPELMIPDQNGTIVPLDRVGVQAQEKEVPVSVTFQISALDGASVASILHSQRDLLTSIISNAMRQRGQKSAFAS